MASGTGAISRHSPAAAQSAAGWSLGDLSGWEDGLLVLAGTALLREGKDVPRVRRLIATLLARGLLGTVFRQIARTDPGAAAGLFLMASRLSASAEHALVACASNTVPELPVEQMEPLTEAAQLLAELGRWSGVLAEDARLRSRLAMIWGRIAPLANMAERFFEDPDPRVRANAIESLWGCTDEEAVERCRRALADDHPRPAANACVGLYLAGCTEAVLHLKNMAGHAEPRFRAAAAWAMGRTGDPRFLPVLAEMRKASPAPVSLLRAIVQARERILAMERLGREEVPLFATRRASEAGLSLQVHAGPGADGFRPLPVHWSMEVNGAVVWDYSAQPSLIGTGIEGWVLQAPNPPAGGIFSIAVSVNTGTHWGRAEIAAG